MPKSQSGSIVALLIAGSLLIGNTAGAQTVIFSETFSVADIPLLNGSINLDNDWFISSSGPGPSITSGALVSQQGNTWDSGILNDPYTLDPGAEPFTIEFDLTVNTVGGVSDAFILQIFDDVSFGGITIYLTTNNTFADVTIGAFDNAFAADLTTLGGMGAFVAGTTYHFTGLFFDGNSLDGFISIEAVSGPGGDILTNAPISLAVDASDMGPIRTGGLTSSEAITFDNWTITTGTTIPMPATQNVGLVILLIAIVLCAAHRMTLAKN